MKSKIIRFFVIAGFLTATFTSCYKDDFDELQKQVDELEQKVAENTKAIQEQIMTQIAKLQSDLTNLAQETQDSFTGIETSLDDITTSLDSISSDVENNAKTVFYGNLITEEDYTAYKEAGADVVTGKVIVTTPEQAAIVSNCRWVGSDLVTELGSLEGIQNVGGNVIVNSTDTIIEFKGLLTIGGDFEIPQHEGLTSVVADELVAITGEFSLDGGLKSLNKVSMKSLELIGSVYINGENTSIVSGKSMIMLDWNSPVIAGDLEIEYLDNAETSVSDVYGDVSISECDITVFNFEGTKMGGDFSFVWNSTETLNAVNLEMISGDVVIDNNNGSGGGGGPVSVGEAGGGLSLMAFDNLKVIDGDVTVTDNKSLFGIFNSLEEVNGDIDFKTGNVKDANVIAFENLVKVEDVYVADHSSMKSLTGFNKVTSVQNIHLGVEYVVVESLEIFNGLEKIESGNINVSLYMKSSRYPNLDLSQSFKVLKSVYKININSYKRESFDGSVKYYESELEAGAFPALEECNALNLVGKIIYNEGFASLDSVSYVVMEYGANTISLPALRTVGKTIKVFLRNTNEAVDLSFPALVSAKDIYFYGYEADADISISAPELKELTSFVYSNYNSTAGSPVKIDAPMPKLTEITKVDLNFKNAVSPVDVTNMLTSLTTLVDAGYYTKVYMQYIDGQKFCGISTFLNNIDLDTFGKKVTFKKDGAIQDDAAAIAEVTSGC